MLSQTRPQDRALFPPQASAPGWCGPSTPWNGRSTIYGAPVYVRHEIVHNRYVVDRPEDKGRDFRRGTRRNPRQHQRAGGVLRPWRAEIGSGRCRRAQFFSLDATCPLVTKVHREAAIHFKRGREILLIGHFAPSRKWSARSASCRRAPCTLIETAEDAKTFLAEGSEQSRLRDPDRRCRSTTPPRSSKC